MNDYYVSLVGDLLGCYLHFRADDEEAVELYLVKTYLRDTTWKLPWCRVYSADQLKENMSTYDMKTPILLEAKCGQLHLADYEYLRKKRRPTTQEKP